jgi:hypothetical protein
MSITTESGAIAPGLDVTVPTPQQMASRMLIELYRATSGRAMQHLNIEWVALKAGILELEHRAAAIAYAVEVGLLEVIEGELIGLTDAGRRLLR